MDKDGNVIAEYESAKKAVEVWEPKKGELVWAWCGGYTSPDTCIFGHNTYPNYAPFNNGKLPEAFKALSSTKPTWDDTKLPL